MNYLEKIIERKRIDVAEAKRAVPIEQLRELCTHSRPPLPFADSIRQRNGIIAEFKRRSPSKGIIHDGISPADVVPRYEQAGVSAVSVLTAPFSAESWPTSNRPPACSASPCCARIL